MSFKDLLDSWQGDRPPELSEERYAIHLTVDDAARVSALAEMFPGSGVEKIVSDLVHAALDEVEAAMPYEAGNKVIREDEFGDPVYEDVGMTPRFLELVRAERSKIDGS